MARIEVKNVSVFNLENAIRGMRNPLSSWEKSDSVIIGDDYSLGRADYDLAKRLILAGPPHRKFLRQVLVSFDLRAPGFFMTEFDTYKVGVTRDSSSTMHTLMSRPVQGDDFDDVDTFTGKLALGDTIYSLNVMREKYAALKEKPDRSTEDNAFLESLFLDMKRNLPQSYMYYSTITANYEVLSTMWYWRHNHRLPHWRKFCVEFIESLPYSEFITGKFK